jgi:tetratricopeptide (TPR) repeat protein
MIKQFLPLLFTFIFSINLFGESHDIYKEISDIKLQLQEIKLLDARDEREKKIEKLEKDIRELDNKFNQNNVDKKEINGKIDTQDKLINTISISIGLFSILITGIVIFFAFKFEKIAKGEAKEESKKEVEIWIEKNKNRILEPIINEGNNLLKNIRKEADILLQDYQSTMKKHNLKDELDSKEKDILEKVNILLESKETENYTISDWSSKFLNYFYKQDYKSAIKALDNALKITNNEIEIAIILVDKGITFDKMNKNEEALTLYEEVIKRFENSKENTVLAQVAKAFVNKGIVFEKMDKNEEALTSYEEVIKRFGNLGNSIILEEVVIALGGKGLILGRLGEFEKAIKTYDELIEKFKDSKENNILEQVLSALVNKIEINLILGNENLKKDLDLYSMLTKGSKEHFSKLEMLQIFEKAKKSNQDEQIKKWQIKFKDTKLEGWSFKELKILSETLEGEVKERILRYINIFENHNKNIEGK